MAIFSLLLFIFIPWKKYIDWSFVLLLLFSIFYCLLLMLDGILAFGTAAIFYFLAPIMFYSFGRYVVDRLRSSEGIVAFLCLTSLFFALNVYISAFVNIYENGFVNITRILPVLGLDATNSIGTLSATLLGLNVSLGLVGLSIFVYCKKMKVWTRVIFLMLTIFSLIVVIHLVNRTGLFIVVLCFFSVTIYNMRKNLWITFIVFLLGSLIVYLIYTYVGVNEDVLSAYEFREEHAYSSSELGGRSGRWFDAIILLVKHPWGYSDLLGVKVHYAHNLWLDVGRLTGFLPLIPLLIVTILYGINFLKLLNKNDFYLSIVFLAYNVVFVLSCMVEPILEGFPLYFFLYVMFWGMQKQYLKICKNIDKLHLRNKT